MHRGTADWVAILLAVGVATALNVITLGVLWEAIAHPSTAGISENATQILTGWGGGMIGVLGAFVGYAFGRRAAKDEKGNGDDGTAQ